MKLKDCKPTGWCVSVNYHDILPIVLKWNRKHLDKLIIITSLTDIKTLSVCKEFDATVHMTDAFYDDGADFNKFKALEEAMCFHKTVGWQIIFDSDILWPSNFGNIEVEKGKLYTPHRYILDQERSELDWHNFQWLDEIEFPGYTQIFHADDEVLGPKPWHPVDCRHAGIGDSIFQRRWTYRNKVRPEVKVAHIGPVGTNWCGRVSPYLDGTRHVNHEEHAQKLQRYMDIRQKTARLDHEFLS